MPLGSVARGDVVRGFISIDAWVEAASGRLSREGAHHGNHLRRPVHHPRRRLPGARAAPTRTARAASSSAAGRGRTSTTSRARRSAPASSAWTHCCSAARPTTSSRAYWPNQGDDDPIAATFNALPKFVVSHSLTDPAWEGTTALSDVATEVRGAEGPLRRDPRDRQRRPRAVAARGRPRRPAEPLPLPVDVRLGQAALRRRHRGAGGVPTRRSRRRLSPRARSRSSTSAPASQSRASTSARSSGAASQDVMSHVGALRRSRGGEYRPTGMGRQRSTHSATAGCWS